MLHNVFLSLHKHYRTGLYLAFGVIASVSIVNAAQAQQTVLSPARLWAGSIAPAPRIPIMGDVDGDGKADLLVLDTGGEGNLDLLRTSALGKPRYPISARAPLGKNLQFAVSGRFQGTKGAEVLLVAQDGTIQLLSQFNAEGKYVQQTPIPVSDRLPGKAVLAATISSGDGYDSAVLADDRGNLLLLRNTHGISATLTFEAIRMKGRLSGLRQLAANGNTLFWIDAAGKVYRSQINGSTIETKPLLQAVSGEKLAVGHFRDTQTNDLLVGTRLLPNGDPTQSLTLINLPIAADAKGDLCWFAADLDGDGRDDLVRVRRSGDRFTGDDILVHFAVGTDGKNDLTCTAHDGIPDSWKTGRIKPGGLDLAALGCKVGHYDILVEVQRIENVPDETVHKELERAVTYFANLPVVNPDGSKGIGLHVIYREPIPMADAPRPWWELGEKYHPANHRGVTHWMVIYNGGGGQSGEMEDRGSCGVGALYASFLHEFGHQLGLDHTGHWAPNWCPIYPSLMNYAYSYQLNGKPDDVGYSDGRLASLVLREGSLSETLPLTPDRVAFLAGPPYHYRMKPTPDGKGTLIDWNWNGIYGEKSVAADINYGYSTTGGLRHTIGKTYSAPVLVASGSGRRSRLLLFSGLLPEGTPVPAQDATTPKSSLSPDIPGRLVLRYWEGTKPASEGPKWSKEIPVADGVTGDASAIALGDITWVAYPTASGVMLRPVTMASNTPHIGDAIPLSGTSGAQPALAVLDGKLILLLWRDEKTPISFRLLYTRGRQLAAAPEYPLDFTSRTPVSAVAAAKVAGESSLWLGLMQDRDDKYTFCGQVRQFVLQPNGTLKQTAQEWVGNEQRGQRGQSRPALLWQPDRALNNRGGQLWFIAAGLFGGNIPIACHYVSTRIADPSVNGGWLQRRYYDEWTQSRSAPGACFYKGEMIFASRWFGNVHGTENDNLFVAFYGRGFEDDPMGDFDDISFIRDIGMAHSIPYMTE